MTFKQNLTLFSKTNSQKACANLLTTKSGDFSPKTLPNCHGATAQKSLKTVYNFNDESSASSVTTTKKDLNDRITLLSNRPQGVFFIFHRAHCHFCSFKIINITQWTRGVKNELSPSFARNYYSFQVQSKLPPKHKKTKETLTGIEHKLQQAAGKKACRNVSRLKAGKQSRRISLMSIGGILSTLLEPISTCTCPSVLCNEDMYTHD